MKRANTPFALAVVLAVLVVGPAEYQTYAVNTADPCREKVRDAESAAQTCACC